MSQSDYFICPFCTAQVPAEALACPQCGSDDQTGWSDETIYDDLDLPDPHYFKAHKPLNIKHILVKLTAAILLIVIFIFIILGIW